MNNIARQMFPEKAQAFDEGRCTTCGKPREHVPFKDELSMKEAQISGMCQPCQDKMFD